MVYAPQRMQVKLMIHLRLMLSESAPPKIPMTANESNRNENGEWKQVLHCKESIGGIHTNRLSFVESNVFP